MSEPSHEKGSQKISRKGSQKSSQKILQLLAKDPEMTIRELAQLLELGDRTIKKHLFNLKENGKLKRIGPDKGGHWEVVKK